MRFSAVLTLSMMVSIILIQAQDPTRNDLQPESFKVGCHCGCSQEGCAPPCCGVEEKLEYLMKEAKVGCHCGCEDQSCAPPCCGVEERAQYEKKAAYKVGCHCGCEDEGCAPPCCGVFLGDY